MSDCAFKSAAFPGFTTAELKAKVEAGTLNAETQIKIVAEIDRRALAAKGDTSVMTQGERLRFLRTGKAR